MFGIFSPSGQFQSIGGLFQGQILPQFQPVFGFPRRRGSCCGSSASSTSVSVNVVVNGTFVFTQAVASDTWVINHTFAGQFPSVTVVDPLGNVVLADVQYTAGLDQVVITFAEPFAGTAYLNV